MLLLLLLIPGGFIITGIYIVSVFVSAFILVFGLVLSIEGIFFKPIYLDSS